MAEQQQGLVGTATPSFEQTHQERAKEVWESTAKPQPITKEDVRGTDPKPDAPVIPDRALVISQLNDLYADTTPSVDPIQEKLAALEESLVPRPEPENPAVYNEIQKLRAELERRDREAIEAEQAVEREARLRTVREGFVESIESTEDFPAIKAAGFAEKVFDQLHAAQQAGEEVSEEELLSKTEADLWNLYEVLHAVRTPTTSEEAPVSQTPTQTPTLTPSLTATDAPRDLESIYADVRGDRRAAAVEVWNNIFNR